LIRIETPAQRGGCFRLASLHADVFHFAWFYARLTLDAFGVRPYRFNRLLELDSPCH
jgi:hypothetical protein